MARAGEQWLSEFNAQNVANSAWALATANHQDEELFAALARAADRRLSDFNAQGVANSPWAFATANRRDEKLFEALAIAPDRRLSEFNAEELANSAWEFAKANQPVLDFQHLRALGTAGSAVARSVADFAKALVSYDCLLL